VATQFEALTSAGQARRLRVLAQEAISRYPIREPRLDLVNNGFNLVYRVRASDGLYVMRVGRPGWREPLDTRSEIAWISALARDTSLPVPEVVANQDGDPVTEVEVEAVPGSRTVIVMRWASGRVIGKSVTLTTIQQVGALMARLHAHSETFMPPADFTTTRLDRAWYFGRPEWLDDARPPASWSRRLTAKLTAAADRAQATIDELHGRSAEIQFVHADLHQRNLLSGPEGLRVIDFDDSCWAHPVQDIAITLFHMGSLVGRSSAFAALRRGYEEQRGWPARARYEVNGAILGRVCGLASLFASELLLPPEVLAQWLARLEEELDEVLALGD
jgi:Ser/Thr protein kinase RdoA (MazF antagonist)